MELQVFENEQFGRVRTLVDEVGSMSILCGVNRVKSKRSSPQVMNALIHMVGSLRAGSFVALAIVKCVP